MPTSKKRVSMKGMGAEAFFNPPTETQQEEDTSILVERQNSMPVQKQAREVLVQKDTSAPVSEKSTRTLVENHTGIPAQKQTRKLIKASYYISEDDDWKLEQIRLQRRRKGVKIDKSALIREAINLLE